MKKIVVRNIGIIVCLSVLFSAVVTGCGDSGSQASASAKTSETTVSNSISENAASTEENEVVEVPEAKLRSFVTYYADGSIYESKEYDKSGNITKIDGCIVTSTVNEAGNTVITKFIEDGITSTVEKTPEGLTVREVDPWGHESTYAYNEDLLLVEEITPINGLVLYEYDSKKRLTGVDYEGTGCYWTYKYDSNGTRSGEYYEGETLLYTDELKVNAEGATVSYQKDETVLAERSWDGKAHYSASRQNYEYDSAGRVTTMTEETFDEDSHEYYVTTVESYTYDPQGNITGKTEKYGNVEYKTRYENEYDEVGRLASVVQYTDEVLAKSTFYSYYAED